MFIERLILIIWVLSQAHLALAQTKGPGIQGPDGNQGLRPTKPRGERHLREWLDEKRKQKEEDAASEDGDGKPSAAADERREKAAAKNPPPPPQVPSSAYLRWDLGLIYPKIISSAAVWNTEPGARLAFSVRLPGAEGKNYRFWTGLRTLAFSGQARFGEETARFAWTYIGPSFSWEWLNLSEQSADEPLAEATPSRRLRISLGIAGVSRQSESELGDHPSELEAKGFGLDGAGAWVEYVFASAFSTQCDWEFSGGLQMGERKLLAYMGLGFSLWLGEASK